MSAEPTNVPDLSPELKAEIDEAMRLLDTMDESGKSQPKQKVVDPAVAAAARPAAVRGPRVIQAGREHRSGMVVSVGPTDIFLEFGPKELGILPRIQYKEEELPQKGQQIDVVVDRFEPEESLFVCSRPGTVQKAAGLMLVAVQIVEARVTGVVNGKDGKPAGLDLEVAGHRAFMPASQISFERVQDLSVYVGEKMAAAVSRVDRSGRGNIILSRRDVLDTERKANAEKLKTTLQEGQTVEGVVRKIMQFGAFVDLGGVDGLVHISDITHDRIGHGEKAVAKFLSEGQRVSVRILKLDWENNRISLGLKQLQADPFTSAPLAEGSEVTARVTKIAEFGAFCEVAPGVEGLIHISELDHKRIAKVDDVVKPDQVLQVKILKIDPQTRRIALSLKALKPAPEVDFGGGPGGKGKKGGRDRDGRSAEEILKETPALRRMREKFKNSQFKGGLS